MYVETKRQVLIKHVQVQYVYHCCLFLIFCQTAMALELKYLESTGLSSSWPHVSVYN